MPDAADGSRAEALTVLKLTDALPGWGAMLCGHGRRDGGPLPVIGPELAAFYCPSRHDHRSRPWSSGDDGPKARVSQLCFQPPGPPAVGLAEVSNSDTPQKASAPYGSLGLKGTAKRRVRAGAAVLEEHRSSCAFWTPTVPTAALEALKAPKAWSKFQEAIRHRLVRKLRKRMGFALVVGVVEIHPKRSLEAGFDIPHLHLVFRGKRPGERRWRIRTWEFDEIIRQALLAAGCGEHDVSTAGTVVKVKKSVGAYLSKYLTKGNRQGSTDRPPNPSEIRVCQWWLMSRELKQLIDDCTVPVDPAFIAWAASRIRQKDPRVAGFCSRVPIPDDRCPPWWRVSFAGVKALGDALVQWLGQTGQDVNPLLEVLPHDSPIPLQHPFGYQHL